MAGNKIRLSNSLISSYPLVLIYAHIGITINDTTSYFIWTVAFN
jgi:hypothetical protein